jgi:GH35 family endo-1,4-beta-xylanase
MTTVRLTAALLALAATAPAAPTAAREELTVQKLSQRIEAHRTASVTLTVTDAKGEASAGAAVTVRQVRRKFLFGCNVYMLGRCGDAAAERAYRRRFAALLNYATLPFYWGSYEREEGNPDAKRLRAMAHWCQSQGIRAKGHPLCWHEVCPGWLKAKPPADVERLQWARVGRDVRTFAGLIDTWDVVNEACVMPEFRREPQNPIRKLAERLGRAKLIQEAFDHARGANPKAMLLLNDYDTSPRYAKLLRDCEAAGVTIDAIGIQSHMHKGYWGAEKTWDVCERFAKLGKPLHFTETTILSGRLKTDDDWQRRRRDWRTTKAGERRQAEQVAEFYTVLFSHPAVEAITWWDFSDRGAWQGAPAGLVRRDMSPKPAYDALMKLINGEWATGPRKLTTDASGRVSFRGFLGDYVVEAAAGRGEFALHKPGKARRTVRLAPPPKPQPARKTP